MNINYILKTNIFIKAKYNINCKSNNNIISKNVALLQHKYNIKAYFS